MDETRRLYRSETEKMLGGVCGGVAEYFGIDPTIVRLAFLAATFFVGVGPLLYLIMWIVVPRRSRLDAAPNEAAREGLDEVREQARRGAQEAKSAYRRWRGGSAGDGNGAAGSGQAPSGGPAAQPPVTDEPPPTDQPPPAPPPPAPEQPPPTEAPDPTGGPAVSEELRGADPPTERP